MEPSKPLDLESELTCSICTEILYQPLTLLDCLHTFCGACLKEWFDHLTSKARPGAAPPLLTCPSCRSPVRDTGHNATVVTLLDMFLAANPDRARTAAEKEEVARQYRPGDVVVRRPAGSEGEGEEEQQRRRRLRRQRRNHEDVDQDGQEDEQEAGGEEDEEEDEDEDEEVLDRRLLEDARELSLREAVATTTRGRETGIRIRSHSRDVSASDRGSDRDQRRRRRRHEQQQQQHYSHRPPRLQLQQQQQQSQSGDERRARRHNDDGQQQQARQVEHQGSLRSLIGIGGGETGMSERDIQREIEDFARQIQEEGLLDGLDLDNIDLLRDDELSRRITEAYRRRQRGRERERELERERERERERDRDRERSRRRPTITGRTSSHVSAPNPPPASSLNPPPASLSEPPLSDSGSAARSRTDERHHHRSASSNRPSASRNGSTMTIHSRSRSTNPTAGQGRVEDRPRAPAAASSTHLEVTAATHQRRRGGGGGGTRSSTTPVAAALAPPPPPHPSRLEVRSHTDVGAQAQSQPATSSPEPSPSSHHLSFASRAASVGPPLSQTSAQQQQQQQRGHGRPADLPMPAPIPPFSSHASQPSPKRNNGQQQQQLLLFREPVITCSACHREHIEYELHYNCAVCERGDWNLCLDCYRAGEGCRAWYGFGREGQARWERAQLLRRPEEGPPPGRPHVLTANRYTPPKAAMTSTPGGGVITHEDPVARLQSGNFCARCFAWANDCWWRCDSCNDGDWGFCHGCVSRGLSCGDPLLPLTYAPPQPQSSSTPPPPPAGPDPGPRPAAATILTVALATESGSLFKPLTFHTRCDVCRGPIPPSHARYHCAGCANAAVATAAPASDVQVCAACYDGLVARGLISAENGPAGWRRCLRGHRMAVVVFRDGRGGQWRHIVQEPVGGWALRTAAVVTVVVDGQVDGGAGSGSAAAGLERWSWYDAASGRKITRIVSRDDVAATPAPSGRDAGLFPPDGGAGARAVAKWAWLPPKRRRRRSRDRGAGDDEGGDDRAGDDSDGGMLAFPRGAKVAEIEDANGEWWSGVYMGREGVFPAAYVRVVEGEPVRVGGGAGGGGGPSGR